MYLHRKNIVTGLPIRRMGWDTHTNLDIPTVRSDIQIGNDINKLLAMGKN